MAKWITAIIFVCILMVSGCIIEKRGEITKAASGITDEIIDDAPLKTEEQKTLFAEEPEEEIIEKKEMTEEIVLVKSKVLEPEELKINVGSTVTWINKDGLKHILMDNDDEFSSFQQLYEENSQFSHTFEDTGTYEYRDTVYGARGTIVVE